MRIRETFPGKVDPTARNRCVCSESSARWRVSAKNPDTYPPELVSFGGGDLCAQHPCLVADFGPTWV